MVGLARRLTVILGIAPLVDVIATKLIRQGPPPHVIIEDAKVVDLLPCVVAICMAISLGHTRARPSAALLEKCGDFDYGPSRVARADHIRPIPRSAVGRNK